MAKKYFKMKQNVNIGRVVSKIVVSAIALYVGGTVINEIGNVLLGTCSPFYKGFKIIGWKVGNNATASAGLPSGYSVDAACTASNNIVYSTADGGILSVVGIIAFASIVMEFVEFKL